MRCFVILLCFLAGAASSQSWLQLNDIGAVISGTTASSVPYKEALCFSVNGKIYVIGAVTPVSVTPAAMLWEYDPQTDTWKEKASYPGLGQLRLSGFVIGNNIYAGTGRSNSTNNVCNDFYKYNISADSWSPIANFPTAREGAAGFSAGAKGYVCCGSTSYTLNPVDLWAYDTTSNTWQQKANFPGVHRIGAGTFSALNKGYVGLGYSYGVNVWQSDFYRYDPLFDSWAAIATFPGQGRHGAGVLSIQNTAVVLCGNSGMPVLNDCYLYNATANSWSSYVSFAGAARSNVICGTYGNRIFAGGGNSVGGGGVFKDWWSLQTDVGVAEFSDADGMIKVYQTGENVVRLKRTDKGQEPLDFRVYNSEGRLTVQDVCGPDEVQFQLSAPGLYIICFGRGKAKPLKFLMR